MKQQLRNNIEKMIKFNKYEIEYYKKLDFKQKLEQFFELMQHTLNAISPEKIEKLHQQKLQHLIKT